jgi:hypothetical protein
MGYVPYVGFMTNWYAIVMTHFVFVKTKQKRTKGSLQQLYENPR